METNEWKEQLDKIKRQFKTDFIANLHANMSGTEEESKMYEDEFKKTEKEFDSFIEKHFIPISELKRWVEENEAEEDEQGLWQAPNRIMSKDIATGHNSALKALKDKFIKE